MSKCVYCNDVFDATTQVKVTCTATQCTNWTHKHCVDNRSSVQGFWYCTEHIHLIPIDQTELNASDRNDEESHNNNTINREIQNNDRNSDNYPSVDENEVVNLINNRDSNVNTRPRKKTLPKNHANDDNDADPFANFDCDVCKSGFSKEKKGVVCCSCLNTFHVACLTEAEADGIQNDQFACQDCIQDKIRRENLKQRQRRDMKNKTADKLMQNQKAAVSRKEDDKPKGNSTPKPNKKNSKSSRSRKKSCVVSSSSESEYPLESVDSSDEEPVKTKALTRKKNSKSPSYRKKKDVSDSSDDSCSEKDVEITQADAMMSLYKLTKEERSKSRYENLPIVDSADTKWSVFYELFKESRKLFSDSQNILRIQKSIKCKEILEIGGINLFDPRTYWSAIKLINKRLCQSYNLLLKETSDIIKLKRMKNDYDSRKIIDFINKVVNYNCMVEKYGSKKHKVDERVISHIANVMPYNLINGWHKIKSKMEDNNRTIRVSHIADYLSRQVSYLNSKMQAEELDPWKESQSIKSFKKPDYNVKRSYTHNAYSPSHEMKSESLANYCWFHKAKGHSSMKCGKLWELSGKEVSELAKKNGICTFCGARRQNNCHQNKNLSCHMENCDFRHHMLFCFKRKNRNDSKNVSNYNNNSKNTSKQKQYNSNFNEKNSRSKRSEKQIEKNMSHRNDDELIPANPANSEESEVEVPQSNFYIHEPPKTLKIKSKGIHRSNLVTGNAISSFNVNNVQARRTASCLLSVVVLKFLDYDELVTILLDSGSSVSIIEESLADKLELKGVWDPLKINWSSEVDRVDYGSRIFEARISGIKPNAREYNINFRTVRNLMMHDQPFDAEEMKELYPHLSPLHLKSYCKVHGIIGWDNSWALNPEKTFKPKNWKPNIPFGIRYPLGDCVVGSINQLSDIYNYLLHKQNNDVNHNVFSTAIINTIRLTNAEERELEEIENRIVGQDYKSFNSEDNNSYEDSRALELLNKYVKKSENDVNYEAPLLWCDENVNLPTEKSFNIALRRLIIVEKSSIKNGRFNECIDQVNNLLSKNYAEIVPQNEIKASHSKVFYIPTFFIQPKNKRTRFIWDAATKVDGKSLNDYLLAGPNLYNSYLQIMFQMQEGKYLIKGDLSEMFHQVIMRQEDRDSLRFLFRQTPDDKLQILRMRVMIFGSKCSPITSQFVKNKIAEGFKDTHPDAADVIIHSTYVDDVITSVDDIEFGKSLILDVRTILKSGGFNLVKLKSNNDKILDSVRSNMSADDLKNGKLFSGEQEEKLLGYVINFDRDEIKIALTLEKIPVDIMNLTIKPTKKQVLQLCMSIFDPLGFIEFLLSKFKLIYHWLIKEKYDWTQVMDDKYFCMWRKCINWLKELQNIQIPRIYSQELTNAKIVQLIGFGDAGTEILCAVIYIRFLDEHRNQLDYRFCCSKSYVVPIKQSRTIPDLELDVACKLAVLMQKVNMAHRIKFHEKIYFTDNMAVKEWICNGAKNPKIYVRNRLLKLNEMTQINEWRWIPTKFQPADFGTKITSMPDTKYANDWFNPLIFQLPEDNWPTQEANIDTQSNVVSHVTVADASDHKIPSLINFSSFDRLMNVMIKVREWKYRAKIVICNNKLENLQLVIKEARTRSAKSKIQKKIDKFEKFKMENLETISKLGENYAQYELSLIRVVQRETFNDEYMSIHNNKPLKRSSKLYNLLPYIDNDGILRAQTRITNNEINRQKFGFDRINPIILPREHHLTRLIILKYHKSSAHHNEKTVIVNLLQRFFIHKIKRTVNMVIRKFCMKCRVANAKPDIPLMGDLPSHRLAYKMPAFTYVIVDLLGPISVKASRFKVNKRYVLVYSCLTTRAIHLELIENLESHATLRAFQNTFNLRGVPKRICSDNGTNFTGGNNILQACHNAWNTELLRRGAIIQPIEWYFSPAKAPHWNGSVERMVGLVKKALKNIQTYMDMKHCLYDDYGLKSVLCEIINMLNSRPLEIFPSDDSQNEFLTPNFFIMGRQNAQTVPPEIVIPKSFTQQWNDIKMISNIIWEKWLKAYFPLMTLREKWIDRSKPIEIGDIVMTADPSIANSWRMGIVEDVVKGSQDQVRSVVIRFGKNKILDKSSFKNSNQLIKSYRDESTSVVTRPALAVARLNISPKIEC